MQHCDFFEWIDNETLEGKQLELSHSETEKEYLHYLIAEENWEMQMKKIGGVKMSSVGRGRWKRERRSFSDVKRL